MRHAKAGDALAFAEDDKKRPITDEGAAITKVIAAYLIKLQPDAIICSDYLRAQQTALVVQEKITRIDGSSLPYLETSSLRSGARWPDWNEYLAKQASERRFTCPLIVSHEPTISEFFFRHAGMHQIPAGFKKSGVGIVKVTDGVTGQLKAFIPPSELLRLCEVNDHSHNP